MVTFSSTNSQATVEPAEVAIPTCSRDIGAVITSAASKDLIAGVVIEPLAVWPDDRGLFFEIARIGRGLIAWFAPETTQVSATFTYAAGQFVTFQMLIDGEPFYRSYSMSSSPATDDDLQVTVKRVPSGVVSNLLIDTVREGDLIDVVTAVADSEVTVQTLVSVRDKMISAYEEIMRMPI